MLSLLTIEPPCYCLFRALNDIQSISNFTNKYKYLLLLDHKHVNKHLFKVSFFVKKITNFAIIVTVRAFPTSDWHENLNVCQFVRISFFLDMRIGISVFFLNNGSKYIQKTGTLGLSNKYTPNEFLILNLI